MIGALIVKGKIRSAFDALNNRDIDKFLAAWADDVTFIYPGNLSVSGEFRGRKAVEDWFRKFMEQFTKIHFTVKKICVNNIFDMIGTNTAAVEWDISETNKDGKEFQNSGVTVINIKGAKAVLARDYISDTEILKKAWGEG